MIRFVVGMVLAGTLLSAPSPLGAPAAPAEPLSLPTVPAPQRWAVLVGINDYIHFDGVEDGDLRGAVNDARSMREVLVARWGFREDHTLLLTDREATKADIQDAVTGWLRDNLAPGDVALFFYAGHGSQTIDMEGDEEDGLDETIAPADVLPTSAEFDITDDELRDWFEALPTRNVVVILDSCHSGTGTRYLTPQVRPRSLPREVPTPAGGTRGTAADEGGLSDGGVMVELAAAAPDQVAMDAVFPGTRSGATFSGGAFTTNLVRQLWRAAPGTNYQDVYDATVEAMKSERFAQDPQIEGVGDASLFGLTAEDTGDLGSGDLMVLGVDADGVSLSQGALLGVTQGSLYETDDALLRVTSVSAERATAAVMAGAPAPTGVAHLVAMAPAGVTLAIDTRSVSSAVRDVVASTVAGLDFADILDADEADLFLHRDDDAVLLASRDGAVRARLGRAGSDLPGALARALGQEAAGERIALMDNPAADFAVTLELTGGVSEMSIGDRVTLRVRSERSGYLTLIDLGTDGGVTVLFPNRFVPEGRIEARVNVEIPTAEMPFRLQASGPAGWGMVRALVTERPLALPTTDAPLLSMKAGQVLAARALEALEASLRAGWKSEADLDGALPVAGWSTAVVNYRVLP